MNTPKTITSGDYTLYIFCLEPLDSDVYTCMNGNQVVKSFKLIVKNPGTTTIKICRIL